MKAAKVFTYMVRVMSVALYAIGIVFASSLSTRTLYAQTDVREDQFNLIRRQTDGKGLRDEVTISRQGNAELSVTSSLEKFPQKLLDKEGNPLKPAPRDAKLSMYGSVTGLKSNLENQTLVTTLNDSLASPLAVQNITWALTEPGVAAGMQQAVSQGLFLSQNTMTAEQNFLNQLNYYPEIREPVGRAYLACVNSNGQVAWSEGVAKCMADKGFEKYGLNFETDPNYGWIRGSDESNPNKMFLSEYLFTVEATEHAQAKGVTTGVFGIEDIRQFYQKYIGDLEFKIVTHDEDELAYTGHSDKANPSVPVIRYTKMPARTDMSDYLYEVRLPKVYKTLLSVSYAYCLHVSGQPVPAPPASSGGPSAPSSSSSSGKVSAQDQQRQKLIDDFSKSSFFLDTAKVSDDQLKELTVDGFTFFEGHMRALDRVLSVTQCSELNPESPEFAYDIEKMSPSRRKYARPEQNYLYGIAYRIARGQILDTLIKLEDFINSLTIGSFNEMFMKTRGTQLIYEAAGSSDLRGLAQYNINGFVQLIEKLMAEAAQYGGQGMKFLQKGEAKSSSGSGSLPSTGPN